MAKPKTPDPAADELPAAPQAPDATDSAAAVDSTANQPSPPVEEKSPDEAGTAAEKSHTALYHFEDGNGLHAVPCEAIPEEGGGYTIVRDGIPVVTGAPASDEPKSGHVIL